MYVVIGIGYVIYNLYKKLNVPPGSAKDQNEASESEIQEDSDGEVRAPVFKSAQEIIEEIRQQSKGSAQTPEFNKEYAVESATSDLDKAAKEEELETAKLLKEQQRLLDIINKEGRRNIEKTNHLDSIHLFDYDKDKKLDRKKRKINVRQAMIYDVIFNRPKY